MLNHVVLMKFKPGVPEEEIRALERLLDDLPNHIPEIRMYEFGRDVLKTERSWDFALVGLFANPETLARYQAHPAHRPVVEKIGSLCEHVATVDFYGTDASAIDAVSRSWERDPLDTLKLRP